MPAAAESKSSPLLLGVDVGTSGAKVMLVEASTGAVIGEAESEYALSTPRPLWSEQSPVDWYRGVLSSVRQVFGDHLDASTRVAALGLTGQMHGLTLLDESQRVLRPAILWNDQRTASQCAAITEVVGGRDRLVEHIGNSMLPGFTAPKLLWVREHEPEIYDRIRHALLPKDYVRLQLTGEFATDVADASGTGLLDVKRRRWSDEMIAALEVDRAWLAPVHESIEVVAKVCEEAAGLTGLPARIPVVAGAGDQAAQAVGCGIIREGDVSVTLGTSGVVFAAGSSYRADPMGTLHAFCHAAPEQWHLMGVMLSAGGSLTWWRDVLEVDDERDTPGPRVNPYEKLLRAAAEAPAGSEGLLFLPYLTGERTPHPDPEARGVFCGLTRRHGRAEMTRAVIEGVTFGLRDSLELIRRTGVNPESVRVSGGGARSEIWRQIMANVFQCPVDTISVTHGAAYGAALIAGVGVGIYSDLEEACAKAIRIQDRSEPDPDAARYEDLYERYRALYPALASEFDRLGEWVRRYDDGG
ncbi:MAG: xylulokinase [Phycisphaerales bacterium]